MKLLTFSLAFGVSLFFFGCNTDQENLEIQSETEVEQSDGKLYKSNKDNNKKIKICHKTSSGFQMLEVSVNALKAHYGHGDLNPDADGDGFTAAYGSLNPCDIGNGDDCDDSNPDVHPGATINCDDGIDNNCDGSIDQKTVETYVPCENCTGGTSGNTYNPRNGKCADRRRNGTLRPGFVPCTSEVCKD